MNEYGFDPKFILSSLINIYVSFVDYKEFLEFIVKDERSYKNENFEKVMTIKERGKIKLDYETSEKFMKLVETLKDLYKDMKSKEISYDDAPEEFLDPITTLLMDDPVKLPSSKAIVDRNTIEKHLLSDPSDPFNRTPLSSDMLINCDQLKNRIEEYKKGKLSKV